MIENYQTKYKFEMKLKTALHIGIGEESPIGAAKIYQNGAGEYCIPGTTIAGIFFDTLANILPDKIIKNKKLWLKCTQNEKDNFYGSPLIFRTSILGSKNDLIIQIRDRVKINNETKTAEYGAKFSYWEIEPENVTFDIDIYIDRLSIRHISNPEHKILENWIEAVAYSWQKEGILIGAFSSSGNGWAKLINIKKENKEINNLNKPEHYKDIFKHYTLEIKIGDEKDSYGTNALLIKGGDSHESIIDNRVIDGVFINTGKRVFIPGSSVKGAFSFFMEKYGEPDWAKLLGKDEKDNPIEYAGDFFVQDLFPIDYNDNHIIQIERHAEDEFTRAVFGTSKFNEERLFHTKFKGKVLIRKNDRFKPDEIEEMIKFLKQGMKHHLIPLGANSCFPEFDILGPYNPAKKEENNG
ncbi:MAG: hypothetical protein KAW92_07145 [Candidatus Cloacimonetes bacterium]|nr:hypothetical protein [Candidatus Cloacimonadota bacterium]